MRIEALKYRTEDKQDIIIFVDCYDQSTRINPISWRIADIHYKTSRQRKYTSLFTQYRDNYKYRNLDLQERHEFLLERCKEFVGKEKLEEALIAAWNISKPDIDNIDTSLT